MKHIIRDDKVLSELEEYVILRGYRGSISHNTYEETVTHDDKDVMGIFVPPEDVVFGLGKMETIERMVEEKVSQKKTIVWDVVYYSLPKYLNLVLKQNPNALCMLWLSEKHYLKKGSLGEKMVKNRDKLLSRECYKSFSGYAYGQLHRMTHIASTGKLGAKRKELVARFGYDVKNASHLIRLLKMGIEALILGELLIERPDNNMLLDIKRGEWELQRVLDYADELFGLLDRALVNSPLQNKVDYHFVNELCKWITMNFYKKHPVIPEIY